MCMLSNRTGGIVDGGRFRAVLASDGMFDFRRVDACVSVSVRLLCAAVFLELAFVGDYKLAVNSGPRCDESGVRCGNSHAMFAASFVSKGWNEAKGVADAKCSKYMRFFRLSSA